MKRPLLMASIAFIPTLALAQSSALPDRSIIVAQNEMPNEQKPDANKPPPAQPQKPPPAPPAAQPPKPPAQPQAPKPPPVQPPKPQAQPQPPAAPPPQQRQVQPPAAQPPKPQVVQPAPQPPKPPVPPSNAQPVQPAQQNLNRAQPPAQQPAAAPKPQAVQPAQQQPKPPAPPQSAQPVQPPAPQNLNRVQPPAQQPAAAPKPAAPAVDAKKPEVAPQIRPEDRRMDALRGERKETKEGKSTVIRERDRTIIRQGNRTIVRHDDDTRFRRGGANVQEVRRGNNTDHVIMRPNGVRIVTTVDSNGRMIRRSRFVNGREYVLFNNRPSSGFNFIIKVPPPVIRIPRERYIVDYRDAPPPLIYDTLIAQPVMPIERAFSLDEVRYNYDVRARMPRIDIDSVNFETGSWDVSPDQAAKLQPIAEAMKRAIAANPNEVYMVEGHTDAVGTDDDNLLLSDRRAEAVTEVLSENFGVPPENMVPQGYGEQNLKVQSNGPEERNRYVSIRRITPLLMSQK